MRERERKIKRVSMCLAKIIFVNLFYYSADFYYYSWVPLYFLVLFMSLTVLFQLTFTFIYSTFNKKFQFQQNKQILNKPLSNDTCTGNLFHTYMTTGLKSSVS